MSRERLSIPFLLALIGSILMIVNGLVVIYSNGPLIAFSAQPAITKYGNWQSFKDLASNGTEASYLYKLRTAEMQVDVRKTFMVSTGTYETRIITYSGAFPGTSLDQVSNSSVVSFLRTQLQLTNDTRVIPDRLLTVEAMERAGFWGRVISGLPELVSGPLVYVWIIFALIVLLLAFLIYLKPYRQKALGLWVVLFSILTIPIGGGFFIGAILGVIGGLAGLEWPMGFRSTLPGTLLNALRLNSKVYRTLAEQPKKLQTAALTIIITAFLASLGTSLYAYNANLMTNSATAFGNLRNTYDVLLNGEIFYGPDVAFGAFSAVAIGVFKWLFLSALVFLFGSKLLSLKIEFATIATVLAFVFVPEIIQLFTPIMFPSQPFLLRGMGSSFFPLPLTWPLTLYYISRIWVFLALFMALAAITELSRSRAFGLALFVSTIYLFINYTVIYPLIALPGLNIVLTNSTLTILAVASVAILIAFLLGTFKRET